MTALRHASLAPLVGSAVLAEVAGATVELIVTEVSDPDVRGGFETFSVLLTGPPQPIAQATYPMYHPALGGFELFVVPVGRDADGIQYEAVLNRASDAST